MNHDVAEQLLNDVTSDLKLCDTFPEILDELR